jgi:hypothetical protein
MVEGLNMGNEKEVDGGWSIVPGKEMDRAFADVFRELLEPGAKEAGRLIADWLGLTADKIGQKRKLNAEIGFRELQAKLSALESVETPKEEELYLLINGLSLTDDPSVRDLWTGLFAKALDPNSPATAERSFISILQTLSSMDAKIIDFLAFAMNTDSELRAGALRFQPEDWKTITADEADKLDKQREENYERQREAVKTIRQKAKDYGIDNLHGDEWSDNLMRQGVIELNVQRQPSLPSNMFPARDVNEVINRLGKQLDHISRRIKVASLKPKSVIGGGTSNSLVNLEITFTAYGKRFAEACGLLG